MKSRKLARINTDLEALLVSLGQESLLSLIAICSAWPKMVGENIASRTFPSHLKDGTLTVGVLNSVWLSQLSFLRSEMARKINDHLGRAAVQSVRLTLQRKPDWRPRPGRLPSATAEPTVEDRAMIDKVCSSIGDPDLRDVVRRVLDRQAALSAKHRS